MQTAVDVKPQGVEAFWLLPDWYKELLKQYIPTPPVNTPVDQGGGLVNVYQAAVAELRLSVGGKPVGYIVSKSGSAGLTITVESLSSEALTVVLTRDLVSLWNVYTFEDVRSSVQLEEAMFKLNPGSKADVSVKVSGLKPGVYSGYIGFRVVESGALYRLPLLLVVPLSLDAGNLRAFHQLNLATGTRDVWDVVTLYLSVDKPLLEPLAITTLSSPGAPGMVSATLTTPSGFYTSFTNTAGYTLVEEGLYTLSLWILFAFEWPINVNFTLLIGAPTVTEKLAWALESLASLSARITSIEASLESTIAALQLLRGELARESQELRERISSLNVTLTVLGRSLEGLAAQLSEARRDLEKLSTTLSNVNSTLAARIAREAERISELESRLQQARGELESMRRDLVGRIESVRGDLTRDIASKAEELNSKIAEVNSKVAEVEGAHSTTRTITLVATLIAIAALAIGAYSVLRSRS